MEKQIIQAGDCQLNCAKILFAIKQRQNGHFKWFFCFLQNFEICKEIVCYKAQIFISKLLYFAICVFLLKKQINLSLHN